MKTQIKESSKLLATIGAGGGFIADVLTPLGPVTKWLFFGLLIISFILLIFFFLNRKSEHSKIKKFLPVSAILTVIFGIFFFLNSNTEKGFLGDNTEVVSNLQNSLFNIEKSIDEINEKQTDILDNIQDIKDIVSGDSELKNMSNSEDLTIVKDLNKRTKHKNAKRIAIVYFRMF
jgi:predicted PurR-regulated permease PerM